MSCNINTLVSRIEILEKQIADQNRRSRLGRAFTAFLILGCMGFFTIAANSEFAAPRLIQAERFEVVNDDGRVVLALSAGANGGQLDLWGTTGSNVLRVWSNENGGDLAIWNNQGKNVFGAYATKTGSETALFNVDGDMVYRAKSENNTGRIDLLDKNNKVVAHLGDGFPSKLHDAICLSTGDILVAEWVPIGCITLLRRVDQHHDIIFTNIDSISHLFEAFT